MIISGPFIFAAATYLLMLVAFYLHRVRSFHIPVMISIVLCDLAMPFYLYATRDWYVRLIEHEDIFSFLLWMHLMLLLTLYVLYFVQIQVVRGMLRDDPEARDAHRSQGAGILIVRALVIATGGLLAEPE